MGDDLQGLPPPPINPPPPAYPGLDAQGAPPIQAPSGAPAEEEIL